MTRWRAAKSSRTHVGLEQRFVASARAISDDLDRRVVVGFSGGPDSLALALLIARTQRVMDIEAVLVHVDHALRPESGEESEIAQSLARQVGLPFVHRKLKPDLIDRHPGAGLEEAARRERFTCFIEEAARNSTDIIALAHHRRDQAETVLLHLIRGSGVSGAGAMEQQSLLVIPWWTTFESQSIYKIWRPLIEEDPDQLAHYVASFGLEPVRDQSNFDESNPRNAIRWKVLPMLEKIQPGAIAAIGRFAAIAAQEDSFISMVVAEAASEFVSGRTRLNREKLNPKGIAIQRRFIKMLAWTAGADQISFDRIEQARALFEQDPSDRIIEIGRNCIATSDNDWVYVGSAADVWSEIEEEHDLMLAPLRWSATDELQLGTHRTRKHFGLRATVAASPAKLGSGASSPIPGAAFDESLILRMLRPGDRWARSGISIREWLRRDGVPPIARSRMLVVASSEGVWWLPSIERPNRDAPQPGEPVFYVEIERSSAGATGGSD